MTTEAEKALKNAEAKIYSALCESGCSHEEAWEVMYDYRGGSTLQIAEKAMEEEEQHWEGDTTIQYAFDNLLSRIKTEIGGK